MKQFNKVQESFKSIHFTKETSLNLVHRRRICALLANVPASIYGAGSIVLLYSLVPFGYQIFILPVTPEFGV